MGDYSKEIDSIEAEHASPNSALEKPFHDDGSLHGFQTDERDLPKGYYRSSFFVGTMFATGLGLSAGVGGFALAAPE